MAYLEACPRCKHGKPGGFQKATCDFCGTALPITKQSTLVEFTKRAEGSPMTMTSIIKRVIADLAHEVRTKGDASERTVEKLETLATPPLTKSVSRREEIERHIEREAEVIRKSDPKLSAAAARGQAWNAAPSLYHEWEDLGTARSSVDFNVDDAWAELAKAYDPTDPRKGFQRAKIALPGLYNTWLQHSRRAGVND